MELEKIKEIGLKAHMYDKIGGCSQAVLGSLQEELGIGDLQSFMAATALVGGVSGRGETCGALLGSLMALGIVEGRKRFEDTSSLNKTCDDSVSLSNVFMRRIEKEYNLRKPLNSTLCRDITRAIYGRTWDLTNPIEKAKFFEAGGHSDWGCPKVCEIAAEAAAELILKIGSKQA